MGKYYGLIIITTLTHPFSTPYADEILNEVAGHECYSFIDRFLGYNQVPIAKEDQKKTTFVCEFGSFITRLCLLD